MAGLGRELLVAGVYGVIPDDNALVSVSAVPNLVCTAAVAAVSVTVWSAVEGWADRGFVWLIATLLLTVAASGAAYVGAARLLRLEELGLVWRLLRRRARRAE